MRAVDPGLVVTVARGSSDHAATYLKYAVELVAGVPVASVGPSVASVYGRQLRLGGAACIGISQSGQSPDIVEMMRSAGAGGRADRGDHQRRRLADGGRLATTRCRCRRGRRRASRRPRPSWPRCWRRWRWWPSGRRTTGSARRWRRCPASSRRRWPATGRRCRTGWCGRTRLRAGPRPGLRHRQRGGAEVQGDLRHPRRELQRGRGAARAGGAGAGAVPGAGAGGDGCGAAAGDRHRRAAGGAGGRRVPDRARAAEGVVAAAVGRRGCIR